MKTTRMRRPVPKAEGARVSPAAEGEGEDRIGRVASELGARALDALLVSAGPNVRYLSGFTGDNANLLVMRDRAILFTDPRYQIQAAQQVACEVKIARGPLVVDVCAAIRRLALGRIGYEPARMSCEAYEALGARLPMRAALTPVRGWIEQLRMVKSAAELARIRRSVKTNSRAFEQVSAHVRAGMKESELAAELEYRMRRLGAEKPSFDTIVAGGARSALPHAQPTARRLERGLVVVDMGALEDGYCSDMTRMLFLGRPDARVRRAYRAVLEAQLAAIAAVRAGVASAHIDGVARQVLQGYGLDQAFVHSTGHGLGLEIHELPHLGRRDRTRLAAGMTITIEPGVYLEGLGGIRIEDTVAVTGQGCEVLTPTSKELRVL